MSSKALRLLALVLAIGASSASVVACTQDPPAEAVPGVRLGMAPRDVRDRFQGGAEGSWQTKVGGGAGASDDTVLEWNAAGATSRTTHARFEFHLGMLVAIRAHLREPIREPRVDVTAKTVTLRAPALGATGDGGASGGGGTDVTVLARDCPTHHEEAEALAAKAR
ncbi:MAG: hypothetical protein JWP87_4872 [Labilithrix sp.]|nr:hypothetical protein [Labilithrix sp.]